ncbi:MAG: phosphoribosylglycinamide formyltransferase [Planctomycetota bacterium]
MSAAPHAFAVLVSGTGRHLENLAQLAANGALAGAPRLVVSNKHGVAALERAARAGVESLVLDAERALDDAAFSARVFEAVAARGCDTVVLAGFLRKLLIPATWAGRVLNIHPSLLPAFGGKGFYGDRVHRAVIERGCQVSGCTAHLVDDEYDHGRVLVQRWCPVEADDTPSSLAARVFAEELQALPEALHRLWQAPPYTST